MTDVRHEQNMLAVLEVFPQPLLLLPFAKQLINITVLILENYLILYRVITQVRQQTGSYEIHINAKVNVIDTSEKGFVENRCSKFLFLSFKFASFFLELFTKLAFQRFCVLLLYSQTKNYHGHYRRFVFKWSNVM